MVCSQCQAIEDVFDQKNARRELKSYQQNGPKKSTRLLIQAFRDEGLENRSLLDIGGGVGVIQLELLGSGIRQVTCVEASSASLAVARDEIARRGLQGQVSCHHGDFVQLASKIQPSDYVSLDRVICCYPDFESLVDSSAKLAGQLYGLVYPRDSWWLRWGARLFSPLLRLVTRSEFQIFIHPSNEVEAIIRKNGFQRKLYRTAGIWQILVYQRLENQPQTSPSNPLIQERQANPANQEGNIPSPAHQNPG